MVHTNRHKEAKLLPPDTFLSRKNAPKSVCGREGPRWGSLQRSPDALAGNGGGPPGRERENERRGGVGKEGKELSPRTKILATALNFTVRRSKCSTC